MAAPGRGRGRGRSPQPPVMDDLGDGQQEFFAAMTNMANTIQEGIPAANAAHAAAAAAAAAGGGGGPAEDRPMTLASFLKINPPIFQGTANPTDADDWISAIERALLAQQVSEGQYVIGPQNFLWSEFAKSVYSRLTSCEESELKKKR
ncbi:hypothetical protein PIB30_017605 [Stylosanthes scabra]|uniref:Uncharacterized protein n=1 Tax=Stylosanthes scabra TaxID=79078 RepID=A0ABU6V6M4_9FABA|nr:hypothetical protein [Stylosanthes scabra]